MADWSKPTLTSTYTNFVTEVSNRDLDAVYGLDPAVTTVTNPVASMIRWNSANGYWEKYNGASWAALAATYNINVSTLGGNAAALYALLASPTFSGTPIAPTAANGTNTTQIATCQFVLAQNVASATKLNTARTINGVSFDGTANISFTTDSVSEGTTNKYYTDARARAALSVSGSLAYNSTTGVLSYTQPTNVSTFTNDSGYITGSAPTITSPTINTPTVKNAANVDQTLTFVSAGTTAWDCNNGAIATVTLTDAQSTTMGAPTNLKKGTYILHVLKGAAGTGAISSWNAVFKWANGVAPTLSTTANAHDILTFVCDGTNLFGLIQTKFS